MHKLFRSPNFKTWLTIVGASSIVIGTSYAFTQQSTRLSANEEPTNLAQSTKKSLENGANPKDLVTNQTVDLRKDYGTFLTITDSSYHVLASSVTLDDQIPLPPEGVFKYTKDHSIDKVTWQPTSGVRSAMYISTYGTAPNEGYVIAGKSLTPYEERIQIYTNLAIVGWLAVVAWTSFFILFANKTK